MHFSTDALSAWSGKKRSAGTYLIIYLFILNKYFLIIHNACIVP